MQKSKKQEKRKCFGHFADPEAIRQAHTKNYIQYCVFADNDTQLIEKLCYCACTHAKSCYKKTFKQHVFYKKFMR